MNNVFKIVLSVAVAAIIFAGIPSQATVIYAPDNSLGYAALVGDGSGISAGAAFGVLTDHNSNSLMAFELGIDLKAESVSTCDETIVLDAIDTFIRMPPGAGGRVANTDLPGVVALRSGLPPDNNGASSRQEPEPVSLALVALGLLGISAGIRRYRVLPAPEST